MNDFLLEIFCEDLPPNSQREGERGLHSVFKEFLKAQKIPFNEISTYTTSRRFLIFIPNLPIKKKRLSKLIRGPITESKDTAIQGFCQSNNIKKDELIIKEIKEKKYYFYEKKIPEQNIFNILRNAIPELLKEIRWQKSMRWSSLNDKWARPIKSIFCLIGNKVVKFSFAGKNSDNKVFGNYVLGNNQVKCDNFLEYKEFMNKNNVILEHDKRQEIIKSKLEEICKKYKLSLNSENKLIDENARLVENPNVMYGEFDEEFFKMPEDFIISIVSGQQKYFSFRNRKGNLSNLFAFVTNHSTDKTKQIEKGHERVLKARFKDALFFINEDSKINLEDRIKILEEIIYFEKLGNLRQKSERISKMSKNFAKIIDFNFSKEQEKISKLCLSDLTTEMVNEFPNLQGYVGNYYAKSEGFSEENSVALIEQYFPGINEKIPTLKLSVCLAVAEKIDKIISTFLSNKKPSGSKDPYGIRRASLGLIRILIENKIDVELNEFMRKNLSLFDFKELKQKLNIQDIINFISVRLSICFKELGLREDIINSFLNKTSFNPYLIFYNCHQLSSFLKSNHGKDFTKSYRRITSIIDNTNNSISSINEKLFLVNEEKILYEKALLIKKNIDDNENFDFYLSNLISLTTPINIFFETVTVNCDETKLRENRYNLLSFCKYVVESKCSFSLLNKKIDE